MRFAHDSNDCSEAHKLQFPWEPTLRRLEVQNILCFGAAISVVAAAAAAAVIIRRQKYSVSSSSQSWRSIFPCRELITWPRTISTFMALFAIYVYMDTSENHVMRVSKAIFRRFFQASLFVLPVFVLLYLSFTQFKGSWKSDGVAPLLPLCAVEPTVSYPCLLTHTGFFPFVFFFFLWEHPHLSHVLFAFFNFFL